MKKAEEKTGKWGRTEERENKKIKWKLKLKKGK
jgi:hypothetical protein